MKAAEQHIVPLAPQAVEAFKQLRPLSGQSEYVFQNLGDPDRPMSGSTINAAFDRIGYGEGRFTLHGLRKTASTILNEQGFRADVIERQLAHTERNKVRAAYNHAEYLPERRQMMRHWADYLDALASGGNKVVSIGAGKAAA
jgi:integrase